MVDEDLDRLNALAERLNHRFGRPRVLRQALTHASRLNRGRRADSYERLEFLGDRVLSLVVAELLFARFTNEREGDIARRHAALVKGETLAKVAADIGLGDYLLLSPGEAEAGGRDNPAILADVCEAVIAALYLDGGLAAARGFIERHWRPLIEAAGLPPRDAKTALQEWAQSRALPLPSYREIGREGPDHDPVFTVEVTVHGQPPVSGCGPSKRAAEQAAATSLLRVLGQRP
ncbi:MAG: ribonuclease III [Kiloniellales bacterium]